MNRFSDYALNYISHENVMVELSADIAIRMDKAYELLVKEYPADDKKIMEATISETCFGIVKMFVKCYPSGNKNELCQMFDELKDVAIELLELEKEENQNE